MELRDYLTVARRRWRTIVAWTLIGVALAATATLLTKPTYQSRTSVLFVVQGATNASDLASGSSYTQKEVQSYAEVATSPIVLAPVIEKLKLNTTPARLARNLSVTVPSETVIIQISVSDQQPQRAADIANAVANELSDKVRELSPKQDGNDTVKAVVIAPALPSQTPESPRALQNLAIGLMLGLGAGVIAASIRDRLDTSVTRASDVTEVTKVPILGAIPFDAQVAGQPMAVSPEKSNRGEAYRKLRTNLRFIMGAQGRNIVLITSSVQGEGKSLTVANLASALAESGQRVLLIDADLRRPRVAERFGLEGAAGLSTVLIGGAGIEDVVQPWTENMDVLTSGVTPPNPSELLDSEAMRALLERAAGEYDVVLIDAPPILPVTDALVLGQMIDGAVMVVGMQKATRPQLREALESLQVLGIKTQGLVLNMVRRRGRNDGYSDYYLPDVVTPTGKRAAK